MILPILVFSTNSSPLLCLHQGVPDPLPEFIPRNAPDQMMDGSPLLIIQINYAALHQHSILKCGPLSDRDIVEYFSRYEIHLFLRKRVADYGFDGAVESRFYLGIFLEEIGFRVSFCIVNLPPNPR
jgi:hypothetical protein